MYKQASVVRYVTFILFSILLIGCATSGQVTDMGISPLGVSDADPAIYSIVVARFPQMRFSGSYTIAPWNIRKKGNDSINGLLYKGQRGFSGNEIYSIDSWSDTAFFAFLIPEGTYEFGYSFPTGTGSVLKSEVVYTMEFSVKAGKVIYMGTHQPNILQEDSMVNNKIVTKSTYLGMDILDNFEEDLKSLRKKFPEIFSGDKFKVTNLSI